MDERELDLNIFYAKKIRALKKTLKKQVKRRESKIAFLKKQIDRIKDQKDRIKDQRDRIVKSVERICPYSAYLPVKTIKGNYTPPVWRTAIQRPDRVDFDSHDIGVQEIHEAIEFLYKVETGVYQSSELRTKIHLRIENVKNGEVRYYLSYPALKDLMLLKYPLEYITDEIVTKMIQLVQQKAER